MAGKNRNKFASKQIEENINLAEKQTIKFT